MKNEYMCLMICLLAAILKVLDKHDEFYELQERAYNFSHNGHGE